MAGVIRVDIGELVLRGFSRAEAEVLVDSVAGALADRFSGGSAPERRDSVVEQVAQAIFEATQHA
jgi:hypothetical protein